MSFRIRSLAGLTALVACGPSVTTDYNEAIPIPVAATYEWIGTANMNGSDPVISNDIVHARIQNAMEAQMAAKGYKKVSNDANAQFYLRYYLGTQTQTSYTTTTMGAGPGYGWGWGGGMGVSTTQPIETTQGNVIVDLVQMGTNTLVWRGTMTGDMSNQAPTQEKVNNATAKVMAGLPPAGGVPPKK